jgi:hypothetical protein
MLTSASGRAKSRMGCQLEKGDGVAASAAKAWKALWLSPVRQHEVVLST